MALTLQLIAFCISLIGIINVDGASYLYNEIMPDGAEWSYHGTNGPEYWCNLNPPYPECCKTKKNQSPVNINLEDTKFPAYRLAYNNYGSTPRSMNLFNNGHTVVLTSVSRRQPSISFNYRGARKVYKLSNVHFHWGKDSLGGSEHTMYKDYSPMEMHFVHDLVSYRSLFAASRNAESIAVIGVFFEICKRNNTRLNGLIDSLKLVKYGLANESITPFKYTNLFPKSHDYFYSYNGSLTTPPCTENVRWIVLNNKVPISEAQLTEFRRLQEKPFSANPSNAVPIVNNFRPLQNLNSRPIYRSNRFP